MVGSGRSWAAVVAVAMVVVTTAASCTPGSGDTPQRSDDATATTQADAESVAATELVTGDCLVGITIGRQQRIEIASASVVDCDGRHDLEVFHLFDLTAEMVRSEDMGVYPGRGRVATAAEIGCNDALDDVGVDTDLLGAIAVWPSRDSWPEGDRTVACAIYLQDGRQFDGRQLQLQSAEVTEG